MRQNKEVDVVSMSDMNPDWPPRPAAEFRAWFERQLSFVPRQYRDSATVEITSESSDGDCHHAVICFSYERPETDEEMEHREMCELDYKTRNDHAERRLLESLLKKHGMPNV
jgi:hypothetical protein